MGRVLLFGDDEKGVLRELLSGPLPETGPPEATAPPHQSGIFPWRTVGSSLVLAGCAQILTVAKLAELIAFLVRLW